MPECVRPAIRTLHQEGPCMSSSRFRRGLRRSAATAGLALLAAAALPALAPRASARVPWLQPCHVKGLAEQALCGTYEVPEDRAAAGGRKIPLRVAVLPARGGRPQPDPLVLLAGGPGQGAVDYAGWADRVFRGVRRHRDVLLVDQRGTGGSRALDCSEPDSTLAQLLASPLPFADSRECLQRLDADVRHYTSFQAMADLDELRDVLGYERLNLWGGSYGTRAALVYLQQYPERVRSVVLDGAAPPEIRFPLSIPGDTQRALGLLWADCAADADCRAQFPDPAAELSGLLQRLEAAPVSVQLLHPLTGRPEQVLLTRDNFLGALRGFLYMPERAAMVPLLVRRAHAEDWGPFAAMYLELLGWSSGTMSLGVTLAVLCSEDVPRIGPGDVERAAEGTLLGRAPIDLWLQACASWPRGQLPPGADRPPPRDVPALVLSGARDPATPPRWGEAALRLLPRGRHLVVPGGGHNVSHLGCMPELIARFVQDADAGALDAACLDTQRRPPFVLDLLGPQP
jgi:pimeloyl-ACP methyl ester carboxylesterase